MRDQPTVPRGFSAIELLVVVAIMGVILAVGLPNFLQYQVRNRLTSPSRDLQSLVYAARLHAVNEHGIAGVAFHTPSANNEFKDHPQVRGRYCAIVFTDMDPADRANALHGNGKWDEVAGERVLRVMPLGKNIFFERPGGSEPTVNCNWTFGTATSDHRVLFSATGQLAQSRASDPEVYLTDRRGNYIRLRLNRFSANLVREKNVPGATTWLGDQAQGRWAWTY